MLPITSDHGDWVVMDGGSHSARPIVNYHGGDDGCLEAFTGKGYRVLGRDVEGTKNKVDQVHVHACMMKSLFGL